MKRRERVSIATVFPRVEGWLAAGLLAIAIIGFVRGSAVEVAIGGSAVLLAGVHLLRRRFDPDVRTALGDLVMLTPLAVLIAESIGSSG